MTILTILLGANLVVFFLFFFLFRKWEKTVSAELEFQEKAIETLSNDLELLRENQLILFAAHNKLVQELEQFKAFRQFKNGKKNVEHWRNENEKSL